MVGQALSVPRSLDALFDVGVVGDLPDGQLLERFTTGHRESAELAFRVLVDRHGPMVSRICRRLLDDPNDAEDAFQATFLVLLRGARTIREQGSVAAWLHGVAVRVASRGRVESARRRRIERHGIRPETERNDDPGRLDLASLIDEELTRLPEKYRAPIVLCYLEGLTHEGAANVKRTVLPGGSAAGRPRSGSARRPRHPRMTAADPTSRLIIEPLWPTCRSSRPLPRPPSLARRLLPRRRRRDSSRRCCNTCSGWLAAHRSGSNDARSVSPALSRSNTSRR